jgi:hypothetical protein
MRAKPLKLIYGEGYQPCEVQEATHVQLHCPGPFPNRIIPVQLKGTRAGTGNWSWNGDTESPTLKPSILTRADFGENREPKVCHSFVNDGKIQFLSDCTHEFAGQTVDLLEVD